MSQQGAAVEFPLQVWSVTGSWPRFRLVDVVRHRSPLIALTILWTYARRVLLCVNVWVAGKPSRFYLIDSSFGCFVSTLVVTIAVPAVLILTEPGQKDDL